MVDGQRAIVGGLNVGDEYLGRISWASRWRDTAIRVLIGSTNLDNRSLHLNFELMLAVADPGLVQEVARMLQQDFAVSDNTNLSHGRLRPWYIRAGIIVARLFSPVL